jgi:hypothetical protein
MLPSHAYFTESQLLRSNRIHDPLILDEAWKTNDAILRSLSSIQMQIESATSAGGMAAVASARALQNG